MNENWREGKKSFAAVCKCQMNRWFSDFMILRVVVSDGVIALDHDRQAKNKEWRLKVTAFRCGDAQAFCIPEINITKKLIKDSKPMILWNLLHRMIGAEYDRLKELDAQAFMRQHNIDCL